MAYYHKPGSGNPGMMGNKKKRKPYSLKKSNTGQNENTGIHSNPSGAGKEMEGKAHIIRDPKSSFPKELNWTGKKGTMTY